ncbi:MAG: ATP-binding cassette domain-containing protein [Alphaproteobacteria bacterium]|nr:ATP-binding cassette domain-containing protein [Alphaproteobacteria bacterium]
MLSLRNLSVAIGGHRLVEKVSFDMAPGESLGLIGPSGSGKSTILRAVAGMIDFTGEILLMGRPLAAWPRLERARLLNMVFQDPYGALHPRHSVARALAEPLILHRMDDREQRIEEALMAVGLPLDVQTSYPHQLSGGQRQRVVIARALMLNPRLLLLDEPTSALDMTVQADILDLLEGLKSSRGLSYLLVAHSLPIVTRLCGKIVRMDQRGEPDLASHGLLN